MERLEDVIWVNDFNDEAMKLFYKDFMELESDPSIDAIPIVISSNGGAVHCCIAMRDLIKSSPKPVATIALGKAFSCGAFLLAAGTKGLRFASKDTHIMVHEVSTGAPMGTATESKRSSKELDLLNTLMEKNFAEDIGMPYNKLIKKMEQHKPFDWYISAQEAQKLGIIDVVEVPRIIGSSFSKRLVIMNKDK